MFFVDVCVSLKCCRTELEHTLISLEEQQKKGKHIVSELKKVVAAEEKSLEAAHAKVAAAKLKLQKYRDMSAAFQTTIDELSSELNPPVAAT